MRQALAGLVLVLALISCGSREPIRQGGPYFFTGWRGYSLPPVLENPVSREVAESRRAYYEAYFDEQGHPILLKKIFDGSIDWVDEYEYQGDALHHRKLTKSNGEVIENDFP